MAFEYLLNQTRDEMELLNEVCAAACINPDNYSNTYILLTLKKDVTPKSIVVDIQNVTDVNLFTNYRFKNCLGDAFLIIVPEPKGIFIEIYGHYIEIAGLIESGKFRKLRQNFEVEKKIHMTEDAIRAAFADMQGLLQETKRNGAKELKKAI